MTKRELCRLPVSHNSVGKLPRGDPNAILPATVLLDRSDVRSFEKLRGPERISLGADLHHM